MVHGSSTAGGAYLPGLSDYVIMHHGVTREEIEDNTGFKLLFDKKIEITEPPTERELALLRELDPEALYTA